MAGNSADPRLAQLPDGRPIACLVCGWNLFFTRSIKLNTAGAELFGFAWANASSLALICARCTHLHEFADPSVVQFASPAE
jgi:hypothetical protein